MNELANTLNLQVDRARNEFAQRFGGEPAGVWQAPGRVNLIGEHTDYNEGFVFPFAIEQRTVIAVRPRADNLLHVETDLTGDAADIEIDNLAPENLSGWSAYVFGVAWAISEFAPDLPTRGGFDMFVTSDVPIGAGLSSSAAIVCSVAHAVNDLWGGGLNLETLAKVGRRAENAAVGAPTGIMDEFASLFGRTDAAVLLDCRSLDAEVIPLGLEAAGLDVLVIDSGVRHEHATGGYADRRAESERAAAFFGVSSLREVKLADLEAAKDTMDPVEFKRARHVLTENQRVLDTVRTLREQGPTAIGQLLLASHASMRDDFEISVPQIDVAVEAAMFGGAVGARLTGGGFGGAAIALVAKDAVERVKTAVVEAYGEYGFAAPGFLSVQPRDGAGRVWPSAE